MAIKEYDTEINQIPFKVIDTPGLCDDLEELENDYKYLEMVRSQVKHIDCMWFVSRLDETRVTNDEKRGFKLICEAFGADVWQHAVIVFTFANSVPSHRYYEALEKRTELIRKVIAKYTDSDVAISIPSVAVDNNNETILNGEKWLGELYTKVFTRISQKATSTFLLATADFVKPKKAEKTSQEKQTLKTREPQPYRFIRDRRFPQEPKLENKSEQEYAPTLHNIPNSSKSPKYERPRIELNERQKVEIRKTINANVIPALAGAGAAIGAMAWFWDR